MKEFPQIRGRWTLEDVLPHRPPMILIDEIAGTDGGTIVCMSTVRADHPFLHGETVSGWAMLECMAQTTGALLGLWARDAGEEVTGGLLLGTPEFEVIVDELQVGDRLRIESRHQWGSDDVWRFSCEVWRDHELVARGILNVLRTAFTGKDARS